MHGLTQFLHMVHINNSNYYIDAYIFLNPSALECAILVYVAYVI